MRISTPTLLSATLGLMLAGCTGQTGTIDPADPGGGGGGDAGTVASSDGGTAADATSNGAPDPLEAAPTCTRKQTWTGGDRGSSQMRPGDACIDCHMQRGAPRFGFAGTVYATGHEPNECYGVDGRAAIGATVVVTDARNQMFMAAVNSAGNFYLESRGTVAMPIHAKVVYMGRERAMVLPVPSGDCNTCHTQTGTNTQKGMAPAPGRIVLP